MSMVPFCDLESGLTENQVSVSARHQLERRSHRCSSVSRIVTEINISTRLEEAWNMLVTESTLRVIW